MYVCIIDLKGKNSVHKNIQTDPELLRDLIFPYIDDMVIYINPNVAKVEDAAPMIPF